MMSNILLLCPSLYRENSSPRTYRSNSYAPDFEVTTNHTNVPIFSVLMKYLYESGQQIDQVIMLASLECHEPKKTEYGEFSTLEYIQTTYNYFADTISNGTSHPIEYNIITVDMKQIEDTAEIHRDISHQLASLNVTSAQIWVDFTSGPRSYAILLVFLMRYFETQKGYIIRDILYANISDWKKSVNTIDSCHAVYRMFNTYSKLEDVSGSLCAPNLQQESIATPLTEAERMLETLYRLSKSLESDLRNAAGDRSEQIRSARDQVERIQQEAKDPSVASMANAIMSRLPETIDKLSQVEYLLDHDEVSAALTRLRETTFSYLASEGVIQVNRVRIPENVETELVTAMFYYESFIAFMQELLEELEKTETLDPVQRLNAKIEETLEKRYTEGEFKNYRTKPAMSDSLRTIYRRVCGQTICRIDRTFVLNVKEILESCELGSASMLLQEMRAYQHKINSIEQIFLQTGFPMACTDYRTHSFYYEFYRNKLTEQAAQLMQTLCTIRRHESSLPITILTFHFPQDGGYKEALEYCKNNIQNIITLSYSCVQPNNGWNYGGTNIEHFQELMNRYMPIHNRVRRLRNAYVHARHVGDDLSNEDKAALCRQSITMLREIAREKNL